MDATPTKALSDEDVQKFIDKLKSVDTDKKVDQIQFFGLTLEETSEISTNALDGLTLTIAPLLKASSQLLVTSILTSFLPFFIPLLPSTPSQHLHLALVQLFPSVNERLNDPKERVHSAANTCVALFGKKCYDAEPNASLGNSTIKGKEKEGLVGFWERHVKETMGGKGWRGKVEVMKVLLSLRRADKSKLSLKPWLSPLVDLLEDGDGNVRDQARETVVALLAPSNTPPAAKMEVKKLLQVRNVRKNIADGIINRIFSTDGPDLTIPSPIAGADDPRSGAATPAISPTGDEIDVVHVASGRDLENEFAQMVPYFQGKETEHNWAPREKSLVRIRGLLKGQAHSKHPDSFIAGLKMGIAEGISKTLLSLRTTVAQQACAVVQELAENLGSAYDPFVENLLPVLAKMAGFTKKIIAEKSQKCVTAIISHTTVHPRLFVAHISSGVEEKNVQTRQYSTFHLKTFLHVHGKRSKGTIESTSAVLETIESAVKKGLADVNPQVRETMRLAFWSFNSIWPSRANTIAENLDATAKKQLDKVNPRDANGTSDPVPAPRPGQARKPTASSAMSALLAEKRRAKAAELAAGRAAQETQRTVSSPVPASPSVEQRARSTSSHFASTSRPTPLGRAVTSPQTSPTPKSQVDSPTTARGIPLPSSPQDLLSRSRSSSLVKTLAQSPPSASGSPVNVKSPLRQSGIPSGPQLSDSGSSGSGRMSLRTPHPPRAASPASETIQGLGVFDADPDLIDLSSGPSRVRSGTTSDTDPELKVQAEQAEKAAKQLLELESRPITVSPVTPARPASAALNGHYHKNGTPSTYILKTPINKFLNGLSPSSSRAAWEDSPRPEAMTPLLFAQLKERKHERTWWLKRQELMDKASPLKSQSRDPSKVILRDVEELESGQPSMRALQKLALFAEEHPLTGDPEDVEINEQIWKEGRVFDKMFGGLMSFLDPRKPIDLLEQALVLLWEMVRAQWLLFEDREDPLVDALFRLRASSNLIIHESVNSLMSLLCEVSEPVYFSHVLQSALRRYLDSSPANAPASAGISNGTDARSSGYTFGLTSIGLSVLRMPVEVVRIEGPKLAPLISEALSQNETIPRRAANVLILAIQAVMLDSQATMDMLNLTEYQKNLVVYLMEKNGLRVDANSRKGLDSVEAEEERKDRVVGEMVGVLEKVSRR